MTEHLDVLGIEFLSWRAKLVYLALAYLADDRRSCSPTLATLAGCCSVSEDTVKRGLAELRSARLVTWTQLTTVGEPGRHPNTYTLRH